MKEKLIEAINATIVPNDEKAITAESLANLLTEIVEAMGTGNGSGQVVFYMGMPNEAMTELTLTPEQKAHNAEMAKLIKESPIPISASVETNALIALEAPDGVDTSKVKYNSVSSMTAYIPQELASFLEVPSECVLIQASIGLAIVFTMDGSASLFAF